MTTSELAGYKAVSDQNFQDEVLLSKEIVLVEFYRPNCSSCGLFEPALLELRKRYDGRFKFLRYNTNESHYFSQKYNIVGEPTTAFFYQGELQGTVVGGSMFGIFESQMHNVLVALATKYNLQPIGRSF